MFGVAEAAPKRVALVIGNGAYNETSGWSRLYSPPLDAEAMEQVLRDGLKFDRVILKTDLSRDRFIDAISEFQQALNPGDTAFFYYSGHGAQSGDDNWLIPVSAGEPTSVLRLQGQSIGLHSLLLGIFEQKQTALNVVVLDACRENPLSRDKGYTGSGLKGIERAALSGETLIGYATGPGKVTPDGGRGALSPYTALLIEELPKPGKSLWEVFGAVSERADQLRHGQQPWKTDTLKRARYLVAEPGSESLAPSKPTFVDEEDKFWASTERCGKPRCYGAYLKRYPRGQYVELAQAQVEDEPRHPVEPSPVGPLKPVVERRESYEPAMVFIRGGSFQMGSPSAEKGRSSDERQHSVRVKDFWLGKYEVTVGQFRRFVEDVGYRTDAEKNAGGTRGCWAWDMDDGEKEWSWRAGVSWREPNKYQVTREEDPVSCVSWNDANAYIEWLNRKTGKPYRLPTEAEWEYAARGGMATAQYWAEEANQACHYANVADMTELPDGSRWSPTHECADGYAFVAPVGQFKANAYGIHDLLGNVGEWTCSAYVQNYDGSETYCASKKPNCQMASRGGSWLDGPAEVRSADRNEFARDNRGNFLGFRLAQGEAD